jgi:hypothetical protein
VVAERSGPALGRAEGAVKSEGLFDRHDMIDGSSNHEDTLIADLWGEGSGVEPGHGGGAVEDFVILLVVEDTRDFDWRGFAGLGEPLERVIEEPGRAGFVERNEVGPSADEDEGIPAGVHEGLGREAKGASAGSHEDAFSAEPSGARLGEVVERCAGAEGLLGIVTVYVFGYKFGGILKAAFFRHEGGELRPIEAIGWEANHDIPASFAEVFDHLLLGDREEHDGGVVDEEAFEGLGFRGVEVEEGRAEVVGGVEPLAVFFEEGVAAGRERAGTGKHRGGQETEPEWEEAGLLVFLPFTDDGKVFAAIRVWAVSDDLAVGDFNEVRIEGTPFFDPLREVRGRPPRPGDFLFGDKRDLGRGLLDADSAGDNEEGENDEENPHDRKLSAARIWPIPCFQKICDLEDIPVEGHLLRLDLARKHRRRTMQFHNG